MRVVACLGVLVAVLLSTAPVAGQSVRPNREPVRLAPDTQGLRRIYQSFLDGIRTKDTASYRDMLTPDYVYTSGDSAIVLMGRNARLQRDVTSTDQWELFHAERCEFARQNLVIAGRCWYRAKGTSNGEMGEWLGVSSITFRQGEDKRWRIASTRPRVLNKVR